MEGPSPCCGATDVGTPRGGGSPPGTTSCLSSKAPQSPHLYRAGVGAAGRSELQTCLPSSLRFPSSARCGSREGTTGRHGTPSLPPVHGNLRAQAAGGAKEPYRRESAQAFGGKSLTSRAESGPEDRKTCR